MLAIQQDNAFNSKTINAKKKKKKNQQHGIVRTAWWLQFEKK